MLFLKLVKRKVFALSPKPKPSWGLCLGDGLVNVFTACLSLGGYLLAAGGKPSVLSQSSFQLMLSWVSSRGESPCGF